MVPISWHAGTVSYADVYTNNWATFIYFLLDVGPLQIKGLFSAHVFIVYSHDLYSDDLRLMADTSFVFQRDPRRPWWL